MKHTLAFLAFFVLSITVISSCGKKEPKVLHSDWIIKKGKYCDKGLGWDSLTVTFDLITYKSINIANNDTIVFTKKNTVDEWNELVKLIDLDAFYSIPNNNSNNFLNKGCNDWYIISAKGRSVTKYTEVDEVVEQINVLQSKLDEIENSIQ